MSPTLSRSRLGFWLTHSLAVVLVQVGDTISFTYSSSYHDVVRVGNTDCDLSAATIVDETGSYQYVVQASDGAQIIFACGRGNHCASGQQVTVNVASGGGGSCPADITGAHPSPVLL